VWALLLSACGCESFTAGSSALWELDVPRQFRAAGESPRGTGERALFDTRTEHDEPARSELPASVPPASTVPADTLSTGSWRDDPVLLSVFEREFAEANPSERAEWQQRFDEVNPGEIPRLVDERHRRMQETRGADDSPVRLVFHSATAESDAAGGDATDSSSAPVVEASPDLTDPNADRSREDHVAAGPADADRQVPVQVGDVRPHPLRGFGETLNAPLVDVFRRSAGSRTSAEAESPLQTTSRDLSWDSVPTQSQVETRARSQAESQSLSQTGAQSQVAALPGSDVRVEPSDAAPETEAELSAQPESDTDKRSGFMATMFEAFGVGGDRGPARESTQTTGMALTLPRAAVLVSPSGAPSTRPASRVTESAQQAEPAESREPELHAVFWEEELDKLIALLETQLSGQQPGQDRASYDAYVRQHVALRLLYLIASRRAEAVQAIPQITAEDQAFWSEYLLALSNSFDDEAMPDPALRAAETSARLRSALRWIESHVPLEVTHAVFCRRIDGFGAYTAHAADEFESGQAVLIYTEVRNFTSEATPGGEFRTVLSSRIEIHQGNEHGPVMLSHDLAASEDLCRSRRNDYFQSYRLQLPSSLTPGPHVLRLTIRDESSGRSGTAMLNFRVR
jgi:hypothetical protein